MDSIKERLAKHGFHLEYDGSESDPDSYYVRRDETGEVAEFIQVQGSRHAPERLTQSCYVWDECNGKFGDDEPWHSLADILNALDNPSEEYTLLTLRLFNGLQFHRAR